ncbi:TetR/AcrR family transcriptional regulator [Nocardioides sp. GCM10027113]|uniref:TetR/AcrR family transcriptional regulator n=1 Tax=unclassified Nocardioides TaxID=2615069 RepID=UPI00360D9655
MSARAAAAEATRLRVVEAAAAAFDAHWYDDVTLRGIAADAGVALQTVVNHFGTKEQLYAAAAELSSQRVHDARWQVAPGDVDAAVDVVVDGYERHGDAYLRAQAVEDRIAVVKPAVERGRRLHEEWVAAVLGAALEGLPPAARRRRLAQLVVATDVLTWKLLRRDKGLSRDETTLAMRELVLALHPTQNH